MSTTSLFYNPTFRFPLFSTPNLKSSNPILFKSFFLPGSNLKSVVYEKNKGFGQKHMTELIRVSSGRCSDGVVSLEIGESDAILSNGSLEFRADSGVQVTLNKLSKWLVTVLFGIAILWRHDVEAIWALMGSVINAVLSVALKKILNQERPVSTMRSDPGMPSSHAQAIFYGVIFVIISLIKFLGFNEVTVIISVLTLALGAYLSWLRVSQQLHTISQVLVGAALGSIFAIAWFKFWNAVMLQAFVSSLLVRICVVVGTAALCIGFLFYVIQHWIKVEL